MITRRVFAFSITALAILLPLRIHAADAGPKAFVEAIYHAYTGKNAKGVALDGDGAVRRYFEAKLAALILKDRKDAARHGDVPALDGDPFVNAQDWDIKTFEVALHDVAPDKAGATVTFSNLGVATTIELALIRQRDGWRIDDIAYADGTLRGLFGKS